MGAGRGGAGLTAGPLPPPAGDRGGAAGRQLLRAALPVPLRAAPGSRLKSLPSSHAATKHLGKPGKALCQSGSSQRAAQVLTEMPPSEALLIRTRGRGGGKRWKCWCLGAVPLLGYAAVLKVAQPVHAATLLLIAAQMTRRLMEAPALRLHAPLTAGRASQALRPILAKRCPLLA